MTADEKEFRRLSYCGTCKTIGTLYGSKSRFLLNYDAVFLAEFLTALADENVREREKSYQSYNCLSLPKKELPDVLKFAATTNLILTKFKLADHISDEKKARYNLLNKTFSEEFQKAESLLKNWNFPVKKVVDILNTQEKREAESKTLDDFAFPTANTTAEFFAHGAKGIGKSQLINTAREIGFDFGKLIYLLDAFEDYEKDFRAGKFNAFRAAFDLTEEKITFAAKRKITAILNALKSEIISKIYELPIAENQKSLFASRLGQNLQRKLKTDLPVLKTKKVCRPKTKITFAERWKMAVQTAKTFAENYSWQMPAVFLFVMIFTLAAPAQTKDIRSARECFDLSFNLMFLGAIFGSVAAFPKPILQKFPKQKKKQKGGEDSEENSGWCDCCDAEDCCCCCCECDGCGDCDCCGGCCDGCDCNCD